MGGSEKPPPDLDGEEVVGGGLSEKPPPDRDGEEVVVVVGYNPFPFYLSEEVVGGGRYTTPDLC